MNTEATLLSFNEHKTAQPILYNMDANFRVAPTGTGNTFFLSLLTRVNEFGVLYGPPVNCRSAQDDNLLDQGKYPVSLVDLAHTDITNEENPFNGNPLQIIIYKEKN